MFALRLKELREERGLSQQAFANKMGISQSSVGMWESGKREPNFETIQKISNFFNVTVDYMLGVETNKTILNKKIYELLTEQCPEDYSLFAKSIGVDMPTVFQWVKGISSSCYNYIDDISKFFGVSIDYLLGKTEEKEIKKDLSDEEFALFGEIKELTEEEQKKVREFVEFIKSRKED